MNKYNQQILSKNATQYNIQYNHLLTINSSKKLSFKSKNDNAKNQKYC
jgi:hemolysin activation/secretion protein